jgi:hypothetical protein
MTSHPNLDRAQAALDAARHGVYAPAFDASTDAVLGETFRQDGRCVYADDRVAISLIHETGTAPGGDRYRHR